MAAPRSDTTGNGIAFARAYAHLFAQEDPKKWDRASFQILLRFGPVMLSPRYPHGRGCSHATAQLSWKLNQTTGSETLINMLCILRIRLLVTLKLNSNAILKYIIR